MNLYEVNKINGENIMIQLEFIESLKVSPDCVVVKMSSGDVHYVTSDSLSAALTHNKVNYFNIENKAEKEEVSE